MNFINQAIERADPFMNNRNIFLLNLQHLNIRPKLRAEIPKRAYTDEWLHDQSHGHQKEHSRAQKIASGQRAETHLHGVSRNCETDVALKDVFPDSVSPILGSAGGSIALLQTPRRQR